MSENRIDPMFKQLRDLESEPSPRVWQNIETDLDNRKRKQVVPLFWQLSAAASVLLAVGMFLFFGSDRNDLTKQAALSTGSEKLIIDSSTEEMVAETLRYEVKGSRSSTSASASTSVSTPASASAPGNIVLVDFNNPGSEANVEHVVKHRNEHRSIAPKYFGKTDEEQAQGAEELIPLLSKSVLIDEKDSPDASRLIAIERKTETNNYIFIPVEKQEEDVNSAQRHFVVGGEYSPTYAFRNASGSLPGSGSESGIMTSGGGISLAMNVNKRWQIETGIKYAMLGQEVSTVSKSNRVFSYSSADEEKIDITEISLVNSLGAVNREISPQMDPVAGGGFRNSPDELVDLHASTDETTETPMLRQNLGYIRVPVTLRYQLLESGSIDFSLSGGISTNWLIDNDAYLETAGEKQRIGETDGLSKTGFSTHAGMAVAVPLYRGLRLRVEPRIDYFISDISEGSSVNFKPYSFGVFTGLFYEW